MKVYIIIFRLGYEPFDEEDLYGVYTNKAKASQIRAELEKNKEDFDKHYYLIEKELE